MRIVDWPEEPAADSGILPVTISDIDFHGTPEELRFIASFLLEEASELDFAQANNSALNVGVELGNVDQQLGLVYGSTSCARLMSR